MEVHSVVVRHEWGISAEEERHVNAWCFHGITTMGDFHGSYGASRVRIVSREETTDGTAASDSRKKRARLNIK